MNIGPELITRCIKRERKAEYEMYKATYGFLMGICLRYLRDKDSANEILNVGFLKILNNVKHYNTEVPFSSWIRTIMINTLIDDYRKTKKEKERIVYVDTYYDSVDYAEVNDALKKFSYNQILDEIAKLPAATQQVFNLYVIDGYSHKEISDFLEISEGTSKWHLNNARQKLKEQLETKILVKVA
jgi:RNA polymerase sigma-70 factor (ECF subfamily)